MIALKPVLLAWLEEAEAARHLATKISNISTVNMRQYRYIRLIEGNAKCRHLKKLSCKGTLRLVFIRVCSQFLAYIQSCCYFKPSFVICTLTCRLSPSLWFNFPPSPFPRVNKYKYTRIQCVREGWYGVLGPTQTNTCRKVPLQVNFFRWRHFALTSMSLISFYYTSHFQILSWLEVLKA